MGILHVFFKVIARMRCTGEYLFKVHTPLEYLTLLAVKSHVTNFVLDDEMWFVDVVLKHWNYYVTTTPSQIVNFQEVYQTLHLDEVIVQNPFCQ